MFFQNKFTPYRYVKSVVVEARPSAGSRVADVVWSDAAYKVISYLLLGFGFGGGLMFGWPMVNSYASLRLEKMGQFLIAFSAKNKQTTEVVAAEEEREEPKLVFEEKNFNISIEKIGLDSLVLVNVDASNPAIYTAVLKQGVAHSKDSGLPGKNRAVYIFGHSTSYEWFVADLNAVFYKLKDLVADDIIVLKQDDKVLSYKVFEKVIVEAGDTKILTENKDKDILILQTCYPPGTILKRLLVLAEPLE